jgi:hypothetical protein
MDFTNMSDDDLRTAHTAACNTIMSGTAAEAEAARAQAVAIEDEADRRAAK